jgi:hypothetical protein
MAQQECLEYQESRANQSLLGRRVEQVRQGPLEQQVKNHRNWLMIFYSYWIKKIFKS